MAVTIMCPNLRCRKVLVVPNALRGTRVRCAYCSTVLSIPKANPSSDLAQSAGGGDTALKGSLRRGKK